MTSPSETPEGLIQKQEKPVFLFRFMHWFIKELLWLARVFISSGDRFYWDNGFSKAASLAYSSLASLVPVTALAFGILASFAVSSPYIPAVREFLFKQFIPSDEFVEKVLNYLVEFSAAVSSLNVLMIGFLVVTSLLLINSIEAVLNETWQVYESRPVAHRIAIFSSILLIAPVLLLSGYYFLTFRLEPFLLDIGVIQFFGAVYQYLLPFLIDFAAFLLLYYLVPKAPVKFRSAVFGAFIAAFLFGFAKAGFAVYLREFSSYDKIYKTLTAIPVSLLWLYLSWVIVLFGAEASYQAQYLPATGKLWKRSLLSIGDARFILAFQCLLKIYESFKEGKKPPNDLELAEYLGCSTMILKPMLGSLEKKGILAKGDSRDMPLTLTRSPEKIYMTDIKEAIFGGRKALFYAWQLEILFGKLSKENDLSKISLADILSCKD